MKKLLLTLLVFPALCCAGSISLGSVQCTQTYICTAVPNNAGDTIEIIYELNYKQLMVFINGFEYTSYAWGAQNLSYVPLHAFNGDGATLVADISFTVVPNGPCVHSGRTTVCPTLVTLNGGTL